MMVFFNKTKASQPAKNTNPYLDGREEWLERYGSYISRAAQWRTFGFVALLALDV